MLIGKDVKQPHEVLDWDIDWADWMPPGDYIDQVRATVRLLSGPAEPALVVDKVESSVAHVSKVWLSGGAHGARWRVQLSCETVEGRVKEAEFDLAVKEV